MSTTSARSPNTTQQQVTAQSSPPHLTMKETTGSLNHSYYPSARRMMVASNNNEPMGGGLKKPRMELTVAHDQWMETSVVMNAGQPQPQPHPQPQPQQLPSVRCTVCKDSDGTPLLYRPSMALHTLFQAPDQDDPSPATARYSKRQTTTHDGTVLHKTDSNQRNSNRLSYLSMYDITDGGGGSSSKKADTSSRIGNDDENGDSTNNKNGADVNVNVDVEEEEEQEEDDDDGLYQRLVIPKQRQSYVTLYDATNDHPIWSLTEQDWHTMTLISRQPPQKYTMMTTSTFSFVWEDQVINGSGGGGGGGGQQSPSSFLFPYQWQMKLAHDGTTMELLCEQCLPDRTKLPVALLANQATQLTLFGNDDDIITTTTLTATADDNNITAMALEEDDGSSKNPFRSLQDSNTKHHQQRKLDSLDTFLVLSSLLLYDLITSQLRALGGGTEAMVMMIDRQQQALKEEVDMFYKQYQQQQLQQTSTMNDDNDVLNRIHHTNSPPQYYSDHGPMMIGQHGMPGEEDDMDREVVMDHHHSDNNNHQQLRWSSNGSMKSLELDPGFWRCCFGYGCWWNWFPCCMPGGWCDRAWIKARGVRRQQHHHHHRSRVTRRMQGWQQQEE